MSRSRCYAQSTFPGPKARAALLHGLTELEAHLQACIVQHTPETLGRQAKVIPTVDHLTDVSCARSYLVTAVAGDAKALSKEELAGLYERTVASALSALAWLIGRCNGQAAHIQLAYCPKTTPVTPLDAVAGNRNDCVLGSGQHCDATGRFGTRRVVHGNALGREAVLGAQQTRQRGGAPRSLPSD